MRAVMHGASRNYKEAISLYNELKLCLRPIEDERIASEVYIPLYRAYLKTDRKNRHRPWLTKFLNYSPARNLKLYYEMKWQNNLPLTNIFKILIDKSSINAILIVD